jgi:CubicO group peptidase (beta-lactamase class C family)
MRSNILPNNDWSESLLNELIDFSMEHGSAELAISYKGSPLIDIVGEAQSIDVFAVQKGILSLLIGIAEEKYLLETCDAINHHLDPEWTGLSPWNEASLTIETLLAMTTGMDDDLNPLGVVAVDWRYNNTAYNYLKKILCLHTDLSLNELSRQWLFEPLGMANTQWEDRDQKLPDGTAFSGLRSCADDLIKIGQLFLDGGRWNDVQLVPKHYIEQLPVGSSKDNPAWGLCWWNNSSEQFMLPMKDKIYAGNVVPTAPQDLVSLRGAFGNFLYMLPQHSLVVARTRKADQGKSAATFETEFWRRLLLAKLS